MSYSSRIPSINTPFTDTAGRMSPVWYEFLRGFVSATVSGTVNPSAPAQSIVAGNGLTSTAVGNTVILTVGQGNGTAVNADDVAVDIASQTAVIVALDDEVLLSDKSENNAIRKTTVRNIMELSAPGGFTANVQYNNNGIFDGNSNFTYDGAGGVSFNSLSSVTLNGNLTYTPNGTGLNVFAGTNPVLTGSTGTATKVCVSFAGNSLTLYGQTSSTSFISAAATGWTIQPASGQTLAITTGGVTLTGMSLYRTLSASITASTTQTQGNGALTSDYNNVSTVAHDNDTVTLPAAVASTLCFVKNAGANILQVFPTSGRDLGNGTDVATTIKPGAHALWICISSSLWHQLEGIMRNSVVSGLTASTTQTQGQQPLTKDVNEISVCANANDVVTMPAAPTYSRSVRIINNGAQILQIFPATGDNLGAGVNTSVTLASGANVCYTNYDSTSWEAI